MIVKHGYVYTLLFLFVFGTSCGGQSKPAPPKEKIASGTKDVSASRWMDTRYEYTDAAGASLVIENGFPRGGIRYTGPDGEVYTYAVFWTRVINETANPLELKIDFPADALEPPWLPGKHYQLLIPPDTMTIDKEGLFNYGLTNLESFLDHRMHKPSSLKRTIHPKGSGGFYVVILGRVTEAAQGALRTGLSLERQDLFYRVSLVKGPPPLSLIGEKAIHCGSINIKGWCCGNKSAASAQQHV